MDWRPGWLEAKPIVCLILRLVSLAHVGLMMKPLVTGAIVTGAIVTGAIVTGAIIRPRDEEGNLIVKTRKPRKNKENDN